MYVNEPAQKAYYAASAVAQLKNQLAGHASNAVPYESIEVRASAHTTDKPGEFKVELFYNIIDKDGNRGSNNSFTYTDPVGRTDIDAVPLFTELSKFVASAR